MRLTPDETSPSNAASHWQPGVVVGNRAVLRPHSRQILRVLQQLLHLAFADQLIVPDPGRTFERHTGDMPAGGDSQLQRLHHRLDVRWRDVVLVLLAHRQCLERDRLHVASKTVVLLRPRLAGFGQIHQPLLRRLAALRIGLGRGSRGGHPLALQRQRGCNRHDPNDGPDNAKQRAATIGRRRMERRLNDLSQRRIYFSLPCSSFTCFSVFSYISASRR